MEEIKLKIQGMSCESCAARIEKVLSKYEYIDTVNVNLLQEYAYLKLKEGYDIETIVDKIKKSRIWSSYEDIEVWYRGNELSVMCI